MKIKTIIFDLDGTLIDPSKAICNSINHALEKRGYPKVKNENLYHYIGRHLMDPFRDVTGVNDEGFLWEMIELYRERYETIGIAENVLYPGIREMLEDLETTNYLASIKPWHASKKILKELGIIQYFKGVYGSELDGTRCDKVELLHYIKDTEGLDKATMVGDRDVDIVAAKECGFYSVAVSYGYGSREELERAGPDIIIDSPTGLAKGLCLYG